MIRPLLCFGLAALLLPACASIKTDSVLKQGYDVGQITRLAVVDGHNPTFKQTTRQALVDSFEMEFLRKGWNIVERSNVQKAIDELNFQNSDLASPEERKALGRILNVEALVIVNVATAGDELSLTAKMVEAETGDLIWLGSGEGDVGRTLSTVAGVIAGAAIGAVVGSEAGGHSGGGAVIGGAAGGAVGHALAPNEMEHAKKVVKEICKHIPQR